MFIFFLDNNNNLLKYLLSNQSEREAEEEGGACHCLLSFQASTNIMLLLFCLTWAEFTP